MSREITQYFYLAMLPAVIPVVAARAGGETSAMPVEALPASFDPPMLAMFISPERKTYRLLRESGYFTVNYIDYSKVDTLALLGAASSRFLPDKLERAGLRLVEARKVPTVALADAAAVIECSLKGVIDVGGDHDIVIGRVEAAFASDDFREGGWAYERYKPVLYLGIGVSGQRITLRFSSIGAAKELEYGAGAQHAVAERGNVYKLVKDSINEIAKRIGKSPEDAAYIMLDALKGILAKRWKG
ncbi:MAG: flavin reductase family protein [Thermoproteaceae archaeon]|jgi:flavin reductase (DIM6/NTAB) family NADH-FMN oxidoreductase RutF|nr:flavin reductase family protein [Thermoproteaceae archaeon]